MLAFAAILATLDDPFYDPPEHLVKYETPQQRRSYTAWASKLRDDLIGDDSGYDKVVPPRSDARSAGGDGWFTDEFSAAGTVVGLQIRFFKVESVKASEGAMPLPLPHVVRLSRGGAARAADRHGSEDAPPPDVKHGRAAPPDVGRPAEHARGEFGGGEQPWRGRRRGARRLGWHPEGFVRDLTPRCHRP